MINPVPVANVPPFTILYSMSPVVVAVRDGDILRALALPPEAVNVAPSLIPTLLAGVTPTLTVPNCTVAAVSIF